jgi:hypothetical protein
VHKYQDGATSAGMACAEIPGRSMPASTSTPAEMIAPVANLGAVVAADSFAIYIAGRAPRQARHRSRPLWLSLVLGR